MAYVPRGVDKAEYMTNEKSSAGGFGLHTGCFDTAE